MRKIRIIFLLVCISSIFSCSKTDEVPGDPQNTIDLNMYDESNGKTLLGFSDVYINNAQNFKSVLSVINGYGKMSGLGENVSLDLTLNNLVKEIAVKQGNLYQVYHTNSLFEFPSGQCAIRRDAAYYKIFVSSVIKAEEEKAVGAEVKFVSEYPHSKGLPEIKHHIGTLQYSSDFLEIELPSDVEWFLERDDDEKHFDIKMENGKLKITLKTQPDKIYGPFGDYDLYIRLGSVYTEIHFFLE